MEREHTGEGAAPDTQSLAEQLRRVGDSTFEPRPFGDYLLIEPIGGGGMAEIYRAERLGAEGFSRELAIKRILPHLSSDQGFVDQFIDEAKLVSSLVHPNIVQIFDLGFIDGQYFIAMEMVRGRDLAAVLSTLAKKDEHMPVAVAVHLACETLRGLHFAHTRTNKLGEPLHLVHRDVSPTNILIAYSGEVKVCDFGIAKVATSEKRTATGTIKGKVRYLAPESFEENTPIDSRLDIFAMGLILYELLTTERAIPGEDPLQAINAIMTRELPPPSSVRPELPREIDGIVARAVAKDRDQRYQSAQEMLDDLTEVLFEQTLRVSAEDVAGFMKDLFADAVTAETERDKSRETNLTEIKNRLRERRQQTDVTVELAVKPAGRRRWLGLVAALVVVTLGGAFGWHLWTTRSATVTVASTPAGAAIVLDGQPTGKTTPAELVGLTAGRTYEIGCRLEGYEAAVQALHTTAGGAHALAMPLSAVPPPAADPPTEPAEPETPSDEPDKPRPGKCRQGQISVIAKGVPWAFVGVDRKKAIGETPLIKHKLAAGTHKLFVWHPDSGKSKIVKVRVKGCGHTPVRVDL